MPRQSKPSESGSEFVFVDANGDEIPDPNIDPDASASGVWVHDPALEDVLIQELADGSAAFSATDSEMRAKGYKKSSGRWVKIDGQNDV